MATWNTDNPKMANQVSADIPDIEENLQELHDVVTAITDGTLGTTEPANFKVDALGAAVVGTTLDMDAKKLILDADQDTSITADTDDQIDIEVAGADDFQITANTFTALSGSTIKADTIAETTGAAGVTIDSVVLKDGGGTFSGDVDAGSGTTKRVSVGGTFVSNANGNPNVSDTILDVDANVAETTWESVGPTDSGKDNIWTALDSVPTDADWVIVKIQHLASETTTGSGSVISSVAVRKNGSSEVYSNLNVVSTIQDYATSAGNVSAGTMAHVRIPVSSSCFDIYWSSAILTNVINLFLEGWGFNPTA